MGCWVAPTIAAELWGVSLLDVLSLIRTGDIPVQQNGGFSFVRFPSISQGGRSIPVAERPATFQLISSGPIPPGDPEPAGADPVHESTVEDVNESELGPPPEEDPADNRIADWRAGRRAAANRRRPPGR